MIGVTFAGFADEAGRSLDLQIEATKRLNWSAIEVRNVDGVNFTTISDDKFHESWEKMRENGIAIPCYGSELCNWARPITTDLQLDIEELARAIPRMHETETKIIRCMSYPNNGLSEEEWKREAVRRLRILARMAEDGGVMLGHENCEGWGGRGAQYSLELLELVDSPAFKFIFDTGNPVGHEQDAMDYYRNVKEHVIHVHIKDGRLTDGKMQFTYCGEGDGCVEEIVADLKKDGYDGCISIEPHLGAVVHEGKEAEGFEAACAKYVEYGRRIMKIYSDG